MLEFKKENLINHLKIVFGCYDDFKCFELSRGDDSET